MKTDYKLEYKSEEKAFITSIGPIGSGCDVEIPNDEDTIHIGTFNFCRNLKSVELPNNITVIGNGAFEKCESLRSIKLPSSIKCIGDRAFAGCKSLKEIYLPD